jgi:HEAT repeat protein
MAISEWLRQRRPPLDLAAEVPHLVSLILDSARFGGEFTGLRGSRRVQQEIFARSHSAPELIGDSDYLLQFIREEIQDPRAVSLLLEGMLDINEDVRRRSITILERLSHIPEVVNGFMKALDDPDQDVRFTARKAIIQHGGERLIDVLLQTALSQHPRAAVEATRCLAQLGEPATQALAELLVANNPAVNFEASVGLGERGESVGRAGLLKALKTDPDESARLRALAAIVRIRDSSADELALSLLSDASPQIRLAAFEVVKHAPKDAQFRALGYIFEHKSSIHSAEQLFDEATDLAIKLHYPISLDVVRSMVKDKGSYWWEEGRLQLLARDGFLEAIPVLEKIGSQDWDKSKPRAALRTLRKIGNFAEVKAAVKRIEKESKDKKIRELAVKILAEFGESSTRENEQSATPSLEALEATSATNPRAAASQAQVLLSSADAELRKGAIRIIRSVQVGEIDALLEEAALTDTEEDIRTLAAAELLRRRCKPNGEGCATADMIEKDGLLKAEDVVEALHSIGADGVCARMMTLFAKSVVTGRSSRKLDSVDWGAFAKHENAEDRLWAIRALVRLGKQDSEPLTLLLSDSSETVRRDAANAVAKLRIMSAIESIKERVLIEDSEMVKKALSDTLAALNPSTL